ncbi:MAG: DUF2871 domain-containing protein [Aerococcus sp.]|nr:DUF2871 domain-containing protein [Aerococcus sp.]
MNTSIAYFLLAMVAGVFCREFTKFNHFTGETVLGMTHAHLLMLGTFLFLGIDVLFHFTHLEENALYQKFYLIYNIALPLMVATMITRGIVQVLQPALSTWMDVAISGVAGLSHIGIFIALLLLLVAIRLELLTSEAAR